MAKVIISRDGSARGVYSPAVDKILRGMGPTKTRRASHVEPVDELRNDAAVWIVNTCSAYRERIVDPVKRKSWRLVNPDPATVAIYKTAIMDLFHDSWWADMLPVKGPVLGPFDTREDALAAEVAWLDQHGTPFPE